MVSPNTPRTDFDVPQYSADIRLWLARGARRPASVHVQERQPLADGSDALLQGWDQHHARGKTLLQKACVAAAASPDQTAESYYDVCDWALAVVPWHRAPAVVAIRVGGERSPASVFVVQVRQTGDTKALDAYMDQLNKQVPWAKA